MKRLFAILFCTALLVGVLAVPASAGFDCPILYVDGVAYSGTAGGGSETCHYYTPDVTTSTPVYTSRHTWNGVNGAENLPCGEGGIHWIDNKNNLVISHCVGVTPKPMYQHDYSNNCTGVGERIQQSLDGGLTWTNIFRGYVKYWADPRVIETYTDPPEPKYGFLAQDFTEPQECLQIDPKFYPVSDCDGWAVYQSGIAEPIDQGVWKDLTTDETFFFSLEKVASVQISRVEPEGFWVVEPQNCGKTCESKPLYYQFTIHNGDQSCTLVSWDTKDEVGQPDKFWIPNVTRQLCNCGFIAESKYEEGWVYQDSCTGEYSYLGKTWRWYREDLLTPHWTGACAAGGGGGECPVK